MGRVIDACIDCKAEIVILTPNDLGMTFCVECQEYLHPHEVVKRYA